MHAVIQNTLFLGVLKWPSPKSEHCCLNTGLILDHVTGKIEGILYCDHKGAFTAKPEDVDTRLVSRGVDKKH